MRFSNQRILVFSVLLLVLELPTLTAAGQTTSAPPDSGAAPDLKSTAVARGLSFGATAATVGAGIWRINPSSRRPGLILIGSGLLFGPATGLIYAEAPDRALRGIGIRAGIGAGSALMTIGSALIVESSEGSWAALGVLAAGVLAGTGLLLAHGLYNTFRGTARAVEAHNESARETARNASSSVSVGPWASPRVGTPGVQVRVSF